MEQFTYSALKKQKERANMLSNDMSSLGTQSGNYGQFKEQARVVTINGAKKIALEIENLRKTFGISHLDINKHLPTLKELIK